MSCLGTRQRLKITLPTQGGFTLLEVLIATAITVLIGVSAVQLLSSIANASQASEETAAELAELQRFNQILSRDIEQYIQRDIRDEFGDVQPSLSTTGEFPIEFTRAGWRNSPIAEDARSTLQRVAYQLEDFDSDVCSGSRAGLDKSLIDQDPALPINGEQKCLVRYYWQIIDRAPDSEAKAQVILQNVEEMVFEILYRKQADADADISVKNPLEVSEDWPVIFGQDNLVSEGIRLRLVHSDIGEITRLWRIVGAVSDFTSESNNE